MSSRGVIAIIELESCTRRRQAGHNSGKSCIYVPGDTDVYDGVRWCSTATIEAPLSCCKVIVHVSYNIDVQ